MSAVNQLLAAYPAPASGYRYWRLRVTGSSGGTTFSLSEWQVRVGTTQTSLSGKTITNNGPYGFDAPYSLSNLNNNFIETTNGTDLAVTYAEFDVYVDMGVPTNVTGYYLGPQYVPYNQVTAFEVYASNTPVPGTLIASFGGISGGGWTTGAYRLFTW